MIGLALVLALQAATAPPGYEALVKEAVALARGGDRAAAEALLWRARALAPSRPEAPVELAGLRFLDRRYAEAVALLRPVVRSGADAHAIDLLATSLHLAGRADDALDEWNRLRRPVLRNVRLHGVHDTRSGLLVPQLAFVEGTLLTRDQLRETRLRLLETAAFDRVRLRPLPLGTEEADLEVAVSERRGFGSPAELAAVTLDKALQRTAWLRYDNAGGTGIGVGASYRWQSAQPRASVGLVWPQPLGAGATLHIEGAWLRQQYDLDGRRPRLEARTADVALRRVLGARTVGELRWHGARRTWSPVDGVNAARPGFVSGLTLQGERRLVDASRHHLDATITVFGAGRPLGSDLGFTTGRLTLRQSVFLAPPEQTTIERSVLALQVAMGEASAGTPLDGLFTAGAASEMALPLRAHRDRRDGILGRAPIGRSIRLLNLEWRRRFLTSGLFQAAAVLFYDGCSVGGVVTAPSSSVLHDLGIGLRLGVLGMVFRIDYARAVSGRSTGALTAGLGQVY